MKSPTAINSATRFPAIFSFNASEARRKQEKACTFSEDKNREGPEEGGEGFEKEAKRERKGFEKFYRQEEEKCPVESK